MTDNYDYEKYYLFVKEQEEYNKKSKYYIKTSYLSCFSSSNIFI